MLTKYAIVDAVNCGLLIMKDKNAPPAHTIFIDLFTIGSNKINWIAAADYLDTPEKTIRRWHFEKKFPAMATKLLLIKYRGFLPYTAKWKNCYFDQDENIVTPYGVCQPSDLAFVHRYKWMGEQSRAELKSLKQSQDIETRAALSAEIAVKMAELTELTDQLTPGKQTQKSRVS